MTQALLITPHALKHPQMELTEATRGYSVLFVISLISIAKRWEVCFWTDYWMTTVFKAAVSKIFVLANFLPFCNLASHSVLSTSPHWHDTFVAWHTFVKAVLFAFVRRAGIGSFPCSAIACVCTGIRGSCSLRVYEQTGPPIMMFSVLIG